MLGYFFHTLLLVPVPLVGAISILNTTAPTWDGATMSSKPCENNHDEEDLSAAAAAYYWTNKNGDHACSGHSLFLAPSTLEHGPSWSFKDETASIVSVHPCIDEMENIYLSNRNGKVRKFSSEGKLLWTNSDNYRSQRAQPITGGPAIMNGVLFVGSTSAVISAIDMETGKLLWRSKYALGAGSDSWSISAHQGMIFAAGRKRVRLRIPDMGGNDVIVALSARDGQVRWQFEPKSDVYNFLGSYVNDPPSLVFADQHGDPYRVRMCDGLLIWENKANAIFSSFTTGGAVIGPNGLLYVTNNVKNMSNTEHGKVTAYDVESGKTVWEKHMPMPANNAPAVGKLGKDDKLSVVIALGQNPGFPDAAAERSGHFWDGREVGWHSELLALDATTGEFTNWKYTPPVYKKPEAYGDRFPDHICMPDSWSNAAISGDGTVYIGHMSGHMFALRDTDGDGAISENHGEVSKYFGERCYQGSPGIAPGILVATPCDGMHVFSTGDSSTVGSMSMGAHMNRLSVSK